MPELISNITQHSAGTSKEKNQSLSTNELLKGEFGALLNSLKQIAPSLNDSASNKIDLYSETAISTTEEGEVESSSNANRTDHLTPHLGTVTEEVVRDHKIHEPVKDELNTVTAQTVAQEQANIEVEDTLESSKTGSSIQLSQEAIKSASGLNAQLEHSRPQKERSDSSTEVGVNRKEQSSSTLVDKPVVDRGIFSKNEKPVVESTIDLSSPKGATNDQSEHVAVTSKEDVKLNTSSDNRASVTVETQHSNPVNRQDAPPNEFQKRDPINAPISEQTTINTNTLTIEAGTSNNTSRNTHSGNERVPRQEIFSNTESGQSAGKTETIARIPTLQATDAASAILTPVRSVHSQPLDQVFNARIPTQNSLNSQTEQHVDAKFNPVPSQYLEGKNPELIQFIQSNKSGVIKPKEEKEQRFALSMTEQADTRLKLLVDSVRPELFGSREGPVGFTTTHTLDEKIQFYNPTVTLSADQSALLKEFMIDPIQGKDQQAIEQNILGYLRLGELPVANASARRALVSSFSKAMQQEMNSSATRQHEQWQKHSFKLDDGNNIDMTTRNVDGILHIKLAASNPELNRLLMSMEQEIKDHLKGELNLELDLQFNNQQENDFSDVLGDGSADQRNSQRQQRSEISENSTPEAAQRLQPSIRTFGYNQMEWIA